MSVVRHCLKPLHANCNFIVYCFSPSQHASIEHTSPSTGYAGGDMSIAWARASRNVHTLLADLAAGSNGFIEWNLM